MCIIHMMVLGAVIFMLYDLTSKYSYPKLGNMIVEIWNFPKFLIANNQPTNPNI